MIKTLNLLALAVVCLLAAALYVIKNDVKHSQARLVSLQIEVEQARKAVLLLEKEQAYLESPARLAELAQKHLGMVPMTKMATHNSTEVLVALTNGSTAKITPASLVKAKDKDQ